MRNKRNNNFHNSSVTNGIAFMLIVFFALVIIFCFRNKDDIGNLNIYFSNNSDSNRNQPFKVIIDDTLIFQFENLNKYNYYDSKRINLLNGKHKIEISSLDNKNVKKEFIYIGNYPNESNLLINFYQNSSYEEHLIFLKDKYFNHLIKKHKLEKDTTQHEFIKFQIDTLFDLDYLKKLDYKPNKIWFNINYHEGPIMIM